MELQLSVCMGREKGNWSDWLEKLIVIAAFFANSEALFHKGGGKKDVFFCNKICV